jgi:hypothetical protein
MPIAYNAKTGEAVRLDESGQWVPTQVAKNPQTGAMLAWGGGGWEPLDTKPANADSAGRLLALAGEGSQQSIADTAGALPGLVARGINTAFGTNLDPSVTSRAVKAGLEGVESGGRAALRALGVSFDDAGPRTPTTATERAALGAGRGVTDALTVALPAGAIANAARPGTMGQGIAQTLASQPVTQAVAGAAGGAVGEATENPLLGLAAGVATPLAGAAVRRAISPVAMNLSPEEQRLAQLAEGMGVQLTPGQATGSKALQTAESVLTTMPFAGNRQNALYDAQRRAFNAAALNTAGVRADRVSPDVIDGAFSRLGATFDDLAARTTVKVDDQLFRDVDTVVQEYGRRLPTDVAPVFQSYVDDLAKMKAAMMPPPPPGAGAAGSVQPAANVQTVQIPGEAFQNIVSGIRARARSASNNPALQEALNNLADAVNDNMIRSAPREVAEAWRTARREYRNLLAIDKAAGAGTQADRNAGNLPFGAFTNAVRQQDPRGFARGRGELNDVARVGDFLAGKIPQSGTEPRSRMANLLTGAAVTGGTGVLGASPGMAVASGVASVTLPPLVQALINSPAGRAYLTNQRAAGFGPIMDQRLLAALLTGQGGGQATQALSAPSSRP